MAGSSTEKPCLKICHLADVHLGFRRYHRMTAQGFNQREADVNAAFREAVEKLVTIQPDIILVAGDLFHTVRPSNAVVTFCFRTLKRLAMHTKAKIILIGGNHDSPKRIDSGSILRLFKEIENVYVSDASIDTFTFPDLDLTVTCAPHAALALGVSKPLRASDDTRFSVLVAHAQVDDRLRSEFGGLLVPFDTLAPNEWDYIALGHVHRFQQIAHNAAYSGSLEHTSGNFWADAGVPRGFIETTLPERQITFHEVQTVRAVETIEPITATLLEPEDLLAAIQQRLDNVLGGIDGKVLRLDVHDVNRDVARNLDYRVIRKYKSRALHLQIDLRISASEETQKQRGTAKKKTLRDEVIRFCEDPTAALREPELIKARLLSYLDSVEAQREIPVD